MWDNMLIRSCSDNPFLLHDFISTWWLHFSRGRQLRIFTTFEDNDLMGGFPLYLDRRRTRFGFCRILRYPGEIAANLTECISLNSQEQFISQLIQGLSERKDWDVLFIERIRKNNSLLKGINDLSLPKGWKLSLRQSDWHFRISLPDSADVYLTSLPKKLRYALRKGKKLCHERGQLLLENVKGADAVRSLYDLFVQLSIKSFRSRGGVSAFEDLGRVSFFRELLVRLEENGRLDAHALKVDEEILAISFGYRFGNGYKYILPTFNPDWSDCEPGHLMIAELIRTAIQRGDTYFDMGNGETLYKRQWCNLREPLFRLEVIAPTIGGKIFSVLTSALVRKAGYSVRKSFSRIKEFQKGKIGETF